MCSWDPTAHGDYHGLLGAKGFYLMPYLLGGVCRTTARVDADNHRLHIVVVGEVGERGHVVGELVDELDALTR